MTRPAVHRRSRAGRHAPLLAGCAALALAIAPHSAAAQEFQPGFRGTESVVEGAASVGTAPNYTQINVLAPKTVINWTPTSTATSGTIDFLPAGASAEFISTNLTDYTVLNRILPGGTATIGINGTITSSVYDGSEGQTAGGNVWFYTPNGFVVGPQAIINVGGLIMTTSDIVFGAANTGGDTFTDASGAILFRGANPSSSITMNSKLIASSTYLAIVSPRIVQSGTVSADRSIAYIAAEEVDLTINAGNFDIAIGQGTSDANGIDHSGTTTGRASAGSGDQKTISFVAVPKNSALTMLLAGDIGYAPADSVFNDGSAIVLSAGADGTADGNIAIGTTYFGNAVTARATGDLTVAPTPPGPFSEGVATTTFASFADLNGYKSATLRSGTGTSIVAQHGLTVASSSGAGGGAVVLEALGGGFGEAGSIRVSGTLSASADHYAGTSDDGTSGLDARAGSVSLRADGGTIEAGTLFASASAYGGLGSLAGGNGQGGTVELRAGLGGSVESGFTSLSAVGHGGPSFASGEQQEPTGGQGGVGRGGTITVADSSGDAQADPTGGSLILSSLFANASAVGGNSGALGAGLGGDAFGGTIRLTFDRQDQSLFGLYATARGSDGNAAVDPLGGTIDMLVGGGVTVNLGQISFDASAVASVDGPVGAFGRGGSISLAVQDEASLNISGGTYLTANAGTAFFSGTPSRSPDVTGGNVRVTVDNASFATRDLFVDVTASNVGASESAGFAKGGTALIEATNGGTITTVPDESFGGTFYVDARANGSNGTFASDLTGGAVTLSARSGGTIEAGSQTLELYAGAHGHTGGGGYEEEYSESFSGSTAGNGANAHGGTIAIDALGGTLLSPILADVTGVGGQADENGGSGTGGTIAVRVQGGGLTGALTAQAYGVGGNSLVEGDAGDARGGRLTLASDADAIFEDFGLSFNGYSLGGLATAGTSGDAHGGSAQIDVIGGTHAWSEASFDARALAGLSLGDGSIAGSAFGDPGGLVFHLGGGANLSVPLLTLDASAHAGANGPGNAAIGGAVTLLVDGLASLTTDEVSLDASASMASQHVDPLDIDSTPTALGGTATVIANSGTITTSRLGVSANAQTGGAMVNAGTATGGTAELGAANGGAIAVIANEDGHGLVVHANGLGAEGPSAAHAFGGTATIFTEGGSVSSANAMVVSASGDASDFAFAYDGLGPVTDFNATGGTASVEMRVGGSGGGAIDAQSLSVAANGRAYPDLSVQGNAGTGTGGTATLSVAQGALTADLVSVLAIGHGGRSANNLDGPAFTSGAGIGGTAGIELTGGSIAADYVEANADGVGGNGDPSGSDGTLALGGLGHGGEASFVASGGSLTAATLAVQAVGTGGTGASATAGPGGRGGNAEGGSARIEASGTAALSVTQPITVAAYALGGAGGPSSEGTRGTGGDAVGGTAAMALADIGFAFAPVTLDASAFGGFGGVAGSGTGGHAAFSLIDSSSAVTAPRTIASLFLEASGYDGSERLSVGGSTAFTAQAGNPESGLSITGHLIAVANGASGPAGNGFTGLITGAPVTAGGVVRINTPSDAVLTIGSGGALQAGGNFTVHVGGSFTSSGPISTAANASVIAPLGISMTDLAVSGTTLLQAINGPVSVSRDVRSGGLVTVLGRSVNLVSLGALSFADADATAGDLAIQTAGDLNLATVDATGAVTLTSTGGSIHNTGAVNGVGIAYTAAGNVRSDAALASGGALSVDAGGTFAAPSVSAVGNVSLSADLGMALSSVVSGGTTLLQADGGSVTVDSLTSPGAVTARALEVTIASPGALTFTEALATDGNLSLTTAGNLALAQGRASDAVTLTSTGGSVSGSGPITAGGNLAVSGQTGITLGAASSGGSTNLTSAGGSVSASGPITASGTLVVSGQTGITLGTASSGASTNLTSGSSSVSASGPISAGGNIAVSGQTGITLGTVSSGGSTNLTSAAGSVSSSGSITAGGNLAVSGQTGIALGAASSGGSTTLTSAAGSVSSSGPINADNNLAVNGQAGITLGTATSGGTTSLASANGAIAVTNLNSVGAVTAAGRSVTIGSSGALTFADLDATAGDIAVNTAGNLSVATVDATGSVTLASAGGALRATGAINGNGITLSSLASLDLASLGTAGALGLTSTSGAVTASGPVTAGGALSVAGHSGITLGTASSGGATSLLAENGTIGVTNLSSAGPVTAIGRAIDIRSQSALSFADARATAGDLRVNTRGDLALARASASGNLNLFSSNGTVSGTGPITAGGTGSISGLTGIALNNLTVGGTTTLFSSAGPITVANLRSGGAVSAIGRSVDIASDGALSFSNARALSGNLRLTTSGDLTVAQAGATGTATFAASGDVRTTGLVEAAGLTVSGVNVRADGLLRSSAALSVSAQQLLTINSLAVGTTMNVAAGDIAIGATGRLGQRGLTRTLTITNQNASLPMNFGGTGKSGEFSLDKAEAARLFADEEIALVARSGSSAPGEVRIGELAMAFGPTTGSANIGAGGLLKVGAPGRIEVNGAVALTTVSSADRFSIDPTRIDVIAGEGSIAMRDTGGTPLGILELQAGTIAVADRATLAEISGTTDFAAISKLLDRPVANGHSDHSLQAGTINLLIGDALYIQNSGATTAYADRRGFRAESLVISSSASSPRIAINGIIETPHGTLVGLDTAEGVTINDTVAAHMEHGASITINGCAVGINCGIPPYVFGGRSEDELNPPLSATQLSEGPSGEMIQVASNQPLITPPLVDEPITGVGNDDLWQPKCDPEGETEGCPANEAPE